MSRKRQALSEEELHRRYPILQRLVGKDSGDAWEAAFTARPDAMYSLLSDVIKLSYATPGRVGQRPMPREEDVDVEALLNGGVTAEPIGRALPKLLGAESLRSFADRVVISRRQLTRIMAGEVMPDPSQLRRIAEAVNKAPSYFLEYRRAMVAAAVVSMLESEPVITNKLFTTYISIDHRRVTSRAPVPG